MLVPVKEHPKVRASGVTPALYAASAPACVVAEVLEADFSSRWRSYCGAGVAFRLILQAKIENSHPCFCSSDEFRAK